jgi:sulfite exporter TauE/SafE
MKQHLKNTALAILLLFGVTACGDNPQLTSAIANTQIELFKIIAWLGAVILGICVIAFCVSLILSNRIVAHGSLFILCFALATLPPSITVYAFLQWIKSAPKDVSGIALLMVAAVLFELFLLYQLINYFKKKDAKTNTPLDEQQGAN